MDKKKRQLIRIASRNYASMNEILKIRVFLKYEKGEQIFRSLDAETKTVLLLIKQAMTERIIMNISRMYDTPSGKIENLALAFVILDDPKVISSANDPFNKENLKAAVKQWKNLPLEEERAQIKGLRNFFIAHDIPSKQGAVPKYRDLYDLVKTTIPIVENLTSGVGVNMNTFDGADEIHKKWVKAFWSHFERAP